MKFFYALNWNWIEKSILHRPKNGNLLLDRNRIVLKLLKQLDDALTAIEPCLGCRIEIGTELRERGQLAELRQIELYFAGDLFDRFNLRGGTDTAHRQADGNSGTHTLIK